MSKALKKLVVAVLFSGGDSPGMNALLRALVRLGLNRHHARILGVKDGYMGLIRTCERLLANDVTWEEVRGLLERRVGTNGVRNPYQDLVWMDHFSVSGIIGLGGILLGSSRCDKFHEEENRLEVMKLLNHRLGVDALVVVGGDGSLRGAAELAAESGLTVVGIPATIDNDYPLTERSLGLDTAVNTVVAAVHNVNATASAHHRIMVLETMGRKAPELAQTAALDSGAEIVVTPDGPLDKKKMERIAERIQQSFRIGRAHAIVLVTEGVQLKPPDPIGPTKALADFLTQRFDRIELHGAVRHIDIRYSVLGHLQRGGSPSAADRQLAAESAECAWNAITAKRPSSGVVAVVNGRLRLRKFDAPPVPHRDEELRRIYQLQKDLSDFGDAKEPDFFEDLSGTTAHSVRKPRRRRSPKTMTSRASKQTSRRPRKATAGRLPKKAR